MDRLLRFLSSQKPLRPSQRGDAAPSWIHRLIKSAILRSILLCPRIGSTDTPLPLIKSARLLYQETVVFGTMYKVATTLR